MHNLSLRTTLLTALGVTVGLCVVCTRGVTAETEGDTWPFGAAAARSAFMGRDLYPLGALGMKCMDASLPPYVPKAGATGRQSFKIDKSVGDDGPTELRVEMLFPGGPAAGAGLEAGDVVTGVNGRAFKDGSVAPMAAALVKAASGGRKGLVTLSVRKGGEGKSKKIAVPVPQGGKEAKDPTRGKERERLVAGALAWLAEKQESGGGFRETLSGPNGAVVQTSLAGLAWLGGGSDLENGPYAENVKSAFEFVRSGLPRTGGRVAVSAGGPSWDQSNWGYAHAAIFLGELYHRSKDEEVRELLVETGKALVERQEASGGWAHGPGGPNALGYLELNIVTGLALTGIGMAKQAGYEVPEEALRKAEDYLRISSGGGGVGYSHKSGQAGAGNIGRTAGCWLGYVALGLGKSPRARKMKKYCTRTAGDVFGGHASLMQHMLLGGIAAHALGGDARKRYWKVQTDNLVLAHAPDGSFQPRPWHETLGMSSNGDVTFGEVWTTAAWTVVLVCEEGGDGRPGLPALCGRLPEKK